MAEDGYLPEITSVIKDQSEEPSQPIYKEIVYNILGQLVPPNYFQQKDLDTESPIFKSELCSHAPGKLAIRVFGKYQKHAFRFLIEMLSSWLLPGRRLSFMNVFLSEFCIPSLGSSPYMICEIIINVNSQIDFEQIKSNLSVIESDVCLGMKSSFYAKRILEVKGLSIDAKTALIQENITNILERKPQYFDFDVLTEMQHILVICRNEFKSQRSSRHLSRIICVQYLFRKSLALKSQFTNQRHLFIKIFRAELQLQDFKKHVLGIIVGFNFLKEKEVFEKRHFIRSIQNHIPNAVWVEGSFFEDRRSPQNFCTFYLELEKCDGKKFTHEEIAKLRKTLPNDLLDGIEQLVQSVFMPRNEEEIMRNVLILGAEVKFLRDLPQVMIAYDEQMQSKLSFTVIVVRILKPGGSSIQQLFKESDTNLEYIHDRCKTVGYLRSKHSKEATIFSVRINKDEFIRRDHSIDLNKARQAIVLELLKIIGEFRDYNGGMISKQNELLQEVKSLMEEEDNFNELLLENLFFSITPIVLRTVLDPEILKTFFLLFQETLEKAFDAEKPYDLQILKRPSYIFIVIRTREQINQEEMMLALNSLQARSSEFATAHLEVHGIFCTGYIFRSPDSARQEQFISTIQNALLNLFNVNESASPVGILPLKEEI